MTREAHTHMNLSAWPWVYIVSPDLEYLHMTVYFTNHLPLLYYNGSLSKVQSNRSIIIVTPFVVTATSNIQTRNSKLRKCWENCMGRWWASIKLNLISANNPQPINLQLESSCRDCCPQSMLDSQSCEASTLPENNAANVSKYFACYIHLQIDLKCIPTHPSPFPPKKTPKTLGCVYRDRGEPQHMVIWLLCLWLCWMIKADVEKTKKFFLKMLSNSSFPYWFLPKRTSVLKKPSIGQN